MAHLPQIPYPPGADPGAQEALTGSLRLCSRGWADHSGRQVIGRLRQSLEL